MILYKYKSLENIWHVLDLVLNERIYCGDWRELNDPFEGRYSLSLEPGDAAESGAVAERLSKLRVACLSSDPQNLLLWSHYADGCKGVAIEVEIPDDCALLHAVTYSLFDPIFDKIPASDKEIIDILTGKTDAWEYEQEYRLISRDRYFSIPAGVKRVLVGHRIDEVREGILRKAVPRTVPIIRTVADRYQAAIRVEGYFQELGL